MDLPKELWEQILTQTDHACYPEAATVCKLWSQIISNKSCDDLLLCIQDRNIHSIMRMGLSCNTLIAVAIICDYPEIANFDDIPKSLFCHYALQNRSWNFLAKFPDNVPVVSLLRSGFESWFYQAALNYQELVFNYDIFAITSINHKEVYRFLEVHQLVSTDLLILELAQYGDLGLYLEISSKLERCSLNVPDKNSRILYRKLFKIDPVIAISILDRFQCSGLAYVALTYCSSGILPEVDSEIIDLVISHGLYNNDLKLLEQCGFQGDMISFNNIPLFLCSRSEQLVQYLIDQISKIALLHEGWVWLIERISYLEQWDYLKIVIKLAPKTLLIKIITLLSTSKIWLIERFSLAKLVMESIK